MIKPSQAVQDFGVLNDGNLDPHIDLCSLTILFLNVYVMGFSFRFK